MAQDPPTYPPSGPLPRTQFLNPFPTINVRAFNPALYHAPEPEVPAIQPELTSEEKVTHILKSSVEAAWKSPQFLVNNSYEIKDPATLDSELSKFYGDPLHTKIYTPFCKHLALTTTEFSKVSSHLKKKPAKLSRFVMFDLLSFFDPEFMEKASLALEEKLLELLDKENSIRPIIIFDEDGKTHRYPSTTNVKEYFKHYMSTSGQDYKTFQTSAGLDEGQWKYFSNNANSLRENERIQMLAYVKARALKRTQKSGRPSRNSQQPLASRQNQYRQSYNEWTAQNLHFGPGLSEPGTPRNSQNGASRKTATEIEAEYPIAGAAPCIAPAQDPVGNQQLSTLSRPLQFP